MSPDVAIAIWQMREETTETGAQTRAAIAEDWGADPDTIARAWDEWRALQAQQVQVIGRGQR